MWQAPSGAGLLVVEKAERDLKGGLIVCSWAIGNCAWGWAKEAPAQAYAAIPAFNKRLFGTQKRSQRLLAGTAGDLALKILNIECYSAQIAELYATDPYTANHSVSVCVLALCIGKLFGYDADTLEALGVGSLLHDVGKLVVPTEIINKPGKLTDDEREIITSHPVAGYLLLKENIDHSLMPDAALDIVLNHHERCDGSGYPDGLTGDKIDDLSKIAAVTDVFDAMTTDRPYRPAFSVDSAISYLLEQRHTLDGEVVDALVSLLYGRRLNAWYAHTFSAGGK